MSPTDRLLRTAAVVAFFSGIACQRPALPEPVESLQSALTTTDQASIDCATPPCLNVSVNLAGGVASVDGVTLTFDQIVGPGLVTEIQEDFDGLLPSGFISDPDVGVPHVWGIDVPTNVFTGNVRVCIHYDPTWIPPSIPESFIELWNVAGPTRIGGPPDSSTHTICGTVTSFSRTPFALEFHVPSPPPMPPAIAAPAVVVAEPVGPQGAGVSFKVRASNWQGAWLPVSCLFPSPSLFPLGTTQNSCVATDPSSGLSASASFLVEVQDTTPPAFFTPPPITVPPTGPSGAQVVYTTPTANDAVDGPSPVLCFPPSGSMFPIGETAVTCFTSDSRGNQASTSFDVIVEKQGLGSTCTSGDECDSSFCVDSVCCNEACGDGASDCQACSRSAGGTIDGTCRPMAARTRCDKPLNFCDWIEPTCDQAALSCPAHVDWATNACRPVSSTTPTDLSGGQGSNGGVTVTLDGPLSSGGGTASIGVQKLPQPPTCPASVPPGFKVGSPNQYWQIETSPPGLPIPGATVCFNYLPTNLTPAQQCNLQLYHGDATTCSWGSPITNDICNSDGMTCGTSSPCSSDESPGTICGHIDDHFSPFGVFAPEPADIPTVTVPGPMVVGATSAAGAVVTFVASAYDTHDGDLLAKCTPASGATFPLGTTTVSCSATNSESFRGEASFTVQVAVQAPTDGTFFLQPINPDGSSIFKKGSTVPVKFRLAGVSAGITNLTARLLVAKVSNGITGTSLEAVSTSAADAGNAFRFDPSCNQYIFNLSTKTMSAGTWTLRADLGDGVDHVINVSLR